MSFAGKTYWIVGASEGLGKALAHALADQGAHLVLSARSEEKLKALDKGVVLPLDVTDMASVTHASRVIETQASDLHGIIYCAGAYEPMRAQDWDGPTAERVADVNYMGALRVLSQVVPKMCERGSGHIVLIGSLAGFTGLPGAIGYGSSKAALMHLAENLRADLLGTGIKVQCLNPGFIRTRLTDKNQFNMPQLMSPEQAADHCIRAMQSGRFSKSFPAPFSWLFLLGRHIPVAWFHRLVGRKV